MRRFFVYFFWTSAVVALLAIVTVAALFIPSVQKAFLVRALSGPDTEVSIDNVRLRPGSAVVSGLSLATPDARIRFEDLDSRFRLRPLLFERTVHVESFTLSDILIETEEPEDPPADLWEEFEGLLIDLPIDFRVDTMELDGIFRSPAGTAVAFAVHGRDLSSRGNEGRIDVSLDVEDPNLPGDGRMFAAIEVRPDFDRDGVFQQLSADFTLGESSDSPPLLRTEFRAERTLNGEDYRATAFAPAGTGPEHIVLVAIGEWSRVDRETRGAVQIDFARNMLPADIGIESIPEFSMKGQTDFLLSGDGDIQLKSENAVRVSEIAARFGMPPEFDELTVNASFDINISDTRLSLDSLDIGIAEQQGVDLVRIGAPSSLGIELNGDGVWSFPDLDQPLLLVDLPGIPPELLNLFLGDLRLSADPITARFALHARNDRFELETPEPLSIRNLVLSGPEGSILDESDIQLTPSAVVSASEFSFGLEIDASLPQARSLAVELQSAGAFPPSDSTLTVGVRAGGLPAEAPVSEITLTGNLSTTHETGNALPDSAGFYLVTEGSLRPKFPAHLPNRINVAGELRRAADGIFYELDSFEATVSPAERDFLLRAGLRQPISLRGGGSVFETLPQGDLLEIELGLLRLDEWIPEEHQNGVAGGHLRGGLRLSRNGDELHLRPAGDSIEIAGLLLGPMDGGERPSLTLALVPFAQIDKANASFGLESLILSAEEQPLLEASIVGGLPLNGSNEAFPRITGEFSLNGNLASVRTILGEGAFPNLHDGAFHADARTTLDPEDFHAEWEGRFALPDLRATDPGNAFAITATFDGEAADTRAQGRVLAGIDDGAVIQDVSLTFEADPNNEGTLPLVEVRGDSEYLDLVRLENLAGIFSADPQPDAVPDDDPAPIESLLPVDLRAEFTVARMKVLPGFDIHDVRIELVGDDETIDVRQARVGFLDDAEIEIAGVLTANNGMLGFASTGRGANIDIADLMRHTQGVAEPDIEGVFSFDYEGSSQGADPAALLGAVDAVLNVTGERGRLRLTVPDRRMERIRRLAGMQEGAIGSVIARLAGAPPGVQALAESVNLLTNIPYDSIDVRLGMSEGRTLVVERLVLAGPFLYAGGAGRLEDFNAEAIEDTRLDLQVELGAAGDLRNQFSILRLLSDQSNALGYRMLRQRPVSITGTVGDPNLREVWDLLIQAGSGAATARETPEDERRRDPVEDAVEGIRGILGW